MTILNKKDMSEEDIKLQYITPAILEKWDKSRITMETKITDERIIFYIGIVAVLLLLSRQKIIITASHTVYSRLKNIVK